MKELIERVLVSAATEMWEEESTLSEYTAATAEHELNLTFHYASSLRRWFPWLDRDFDVQKRPWANRRPDIIFHRRGNHDENFLVVEVKRANDLGGGRDDLSKIRKFWFSEPLCYCFGASVVLDEEHETGDVCVIRADESVQPLIYLPMSAISRVSKPRSKHELDEMNQQLAASPTKR